MLKKTWRLTTEQFDAAWQTGKRVKGEFCMVIAARDVYDQYHPKMAVSVPKKAIKKAWARNRMRRRVYHIAEPAIYNNTKPLAIIVVLNKHAAAAPKTQLADDILSTLHQVLG